MTRIIKGLGALILMAVLFVAPPLLLIKLAGNPIPSWDRLVQALTTIDYGGEFLVGTVLPLVGWVAYAVFVIGFLAEIPAQITAAAAARSGRARPARARARLRLPGQKYSGALIAAVLMIFVPTAGAFAATPADVGATSISASVSSTQAVPGAQTSTPAPATETASTSTYTVQEGDSLWSIADAHLGDGNRWGEIRDLNLDKAQPGGYTVGERDGIDPGMVLELPADPAAAPAASTGMHVVQPGETLSSISQETTGSPDNYAAIFDASTSIEQPGGAHLSDPDLILPGWTVATPGAAAASAPAPAEAAPAPEAAPAAPAPDQAAPAAPAPEAAPAAPEAAAPAAPSTEEAPKAEQPADTGLGYVTSAPKAAAPAATNAPATTHADDASKGETTPIAEFVSDWGVAGGMGGILAAGLLTALGWKLRQQRRNRKAGEQIPQLADDPIAAETGMRAVEAPHDMQAVDQALRLLAVWAQDTHTPLPPLYALQLSEDAIQLFLEKPMTLPAPFVATLEDEMVWAIAYEDITELPRIPSAPYPALVTLGYDANGVQMLVDLERLGSLNLQGDDDLRTAVLRSIALSLATSDWGASLQITLVGFGQEIPDAIGHARLRYVEDTDTLLRNLRGQAETVAAALETVGFSSVEEARTADPLADSWTPEIVVLGQALDQAVADEINELVTRIPRVGVAAIANGRRDGGWNLELLRADAPADGEEPEVIAELEIPDSGGAVLELTPQMIIDEFYAAVLARCEVANREDGVPYYDASPEVHIDEIGTAAAATAPTLTLVGQAPTTATDDVEISDETTDYVETVAEVEAAPAGDVAEEEAVADAPDAALASTETLVHAGVADAAEPAADPETSTVTVDHPPAAVTVEEPVDEEILAPVVDLHVPRVQVLGPVEILNPQGTTPTSEAGIKQWNSQVLRATELCAYIALHRGARTEQVHKAMWGEKSDPVKGTDTRNRMKNNLKRWLGNDSQGVPYVPDALGGVYDLHPAITTDWDDFKALVGDDPAAAPTGALLRALRLVKGAPFSGIKPKYYAWIDEPVSLKQTMITTIADSAHELATRALREGNVRDARLAGDVGRAVEPENERHWRNSLRAEHLAGDYTAIDRLLVLLDQQLAGMDPDHSEREPETDELVEQIHNRRAQAS